MTGNSTVEKLLDSFKRKKYFDEEEFNVILLTNELFGRRALQCL